MMVGGVMAMGIASVGGAGGATGSNAPSMPTDGLSGAWQVDNGSKSFTDLLSNELKGHMTMVLALDTGDDKKSTSNREVALALYIEIAAQSLQAMQSMGGSGAMVAGGMGGGISV
jgi:hypothetical protein